VLMATTPQAANQPMTYSTSRNACQMTCIFSQQHADQNAAFTTPLSTSALLQVTWYNTVEVVISCCWLHTACSTSRQMHRTQHNLQQYTSRLHTK
jgi:hypothetical protein